MPPKITLPGEVDGPDAVVAVEWLAGAVMGMTYVI